MNAKYQNELWNTIKVKYLETHNPAGTIVPESNETIEFRETMKYFEDKGLLKRPLYWEGDGLCSYKLSEMAIDQILSKN